MKLSEMALENFREIFEMLTTEFFNSTSLIGSDGTVWTLPSPIM